MKSVTRVFYGWICMLQVIGSSGCMDRSPAPVCPVPIEISSADAATAEFDGVDIVVVIDNSGSMEAEQQILSTGFFTLINSLTKPLNDGSWDYPPVENMRVAIVSSDMGYQYGADRNTENAPSGEYCQKNGRTGDDGRFLSEPLFQTTPVISGAIRCDADGEQCPDRYTCVDGRCRSQSGDDLLSCDFTDHSAYVATEKQTPNPMFAERLACLARQGTDGCPFEQQLEASVRALEHEEQQSFILPTHLLAVLVVSDEEDCSIKSADLFSTEEWGDNNEYNNVACNLNEQTLFETGRYREKLLAAKNNQSEAVIFAAIVGVPTSDACQGTGTQIQERGCLDQEAMKMIVTDFDSSDGKSTYKHFRQACDRYDKDGNELTLARPGRRFVKVAEDFGANGYVYSICNEDWGPAMETIAGIIARQIQPTCYPKQLEWMMLPDDEKDKYPGCEGCGWAKCDVVMQRFIPLAELEREPLCPAALYEGLSDADRAKYEDMITVEKESSGGSVEGKTVLCPIPKLPTKLDCKTARQQVDSFYSNRAGWFYCENTDETAGLSSCTDGLDNDENNVKDCEDSACRDCRECGGATTECVEGCRFGVALNEKAKESSAGTSVFVKCLQRFRMKDQNCIEDSSLVCADGKDNDGNGVWDCDDTLTDPDANDPHLSDPNCCPMTEEGGICKPLMSQISANCGGSDKLRSYGSDFWADPANAKMVDACKAQKEALPCEWE